MISCPEKSVYTSRNFIIGTMAFLSICVTLIVLCVVLIPGSHGSSATTPTFPLVSESTITYYSSYPQCCPDSPNYDPNADTEECDDYSGCEYLGDFAAFCSDSNPDCHVSLDYVQTHNLVAFYDNSDKSGKYWEERYANKTIQITKKTDSQTYVFNATIVDTCGNGDCSNCCAKNSDKKTGYLVDIEYYTVMNNFGTTNLVDGTITFEIF